ncbi:hypothetical protein F5X98DRAFT_333430 [Xylaria grammica]|nr:hypothetical protein F5X98DRAFT_333430 [Xylaria grammica]
MSAPHIVLPRLLGIAPNSLALSCSATGTTPGSSVRCVVRKSALGEENNVRDRPVYLRGTECIVISEIPLIRRDFNRPVMGV